MPYDVLTLSPMGWYVRFLSRIFQVSEFIMDIDIGVYFIYCLDCQNFHRVIREIKVFVGLSSPVGEDTGSVVV